MRYCAPVLLLEQIPRSDDRESHCIRRRRLDQGTQRAALRKLLIEGA
jgi:hypothetical protein